MNKTLQIQNCCFEYCWLYGFCVLAGHSHQAGITTKTTQNIFRPYRHCVFIRASSSHPIPPWYQGSWGQHGAHLGPTGTRWAPCWPHEPCYLSNSTDKIHIMQFLFDINQIGYYAIYLVIWIIWTGCMPENLNLECEANINHPVISSFNSQRFGAYLTKELMTQVNWWDKSARSSWCCNFPWRVRCICRAWICHYIPWFKVCIITCPWTDFSVGSMAVWYNSDSTK